MAAAVASLPPLQLAESQSNTELQTLALAAAAVPLASPTGPEEVAAAAESAAEPAEVGDKAASAAVIPAAGGSRGSSSITPTPRQPVKPAVAPAAASTSAKKGSKK